MATKVPTKSENNALARTARHAIAKSVLDISELNIACNGGVIELYGQIKTPRDYAGTMDTRKEFEKLKTMIMAVRGVREVNGTRVRIFN